MTTTVIAAWVGATTGVLSLAINAFNVWRGFGADTRAKQVALRAELRVLVEGVADDLETFERALNRGVDVPAVGACVAQGMEAFNKLADRLTKPGPVLIYRAGMHVEKIKIVWDRLVFWQERPDASDPEEVRKRAATEVSARGPLNTAKSSIKGILTALNDLDKRSA